MPPEPIRPRPSKAAMAAAREADRGTMLSRRSVSRETVDRLDAFVALLVRWQASINLVSPSTLAQPWTRHVEDGLALYALRPGPQRWADLGSGAGLPGIVLAIQLAESGGAIDLVESNGKKAAFLRTAVRELELPAVVHSSRIEDAPQVLQAADIVTARALASLPQLLDWVGPHLRDEALCLFPKGRDHQREIDAASAHWGYDMVKHDPKTEAGSVILEMSALHRLDVASA